MYVLVVALTSARYGRGVVNAPPTYRLPFAITSARTVLLGLLELVKAETTAPVVPLTSARFLCVEPPTEVNEPPT